MSNKIIAETVEDALAEVAAGYQPTGTAGRLLAAEVERLRAELGAARENIGRQIVDYASVLQKVVDLEAENAELRATVSELSDISTEHARDFQEKRKEVEALKAKLAWFVKYLEHADIIRVAYTNDGYTIEDVHDFINELNTWVEDSPPPNGITLREPNP